MRATRDTDEHLPRIVLVHNMYEKTVNAASVWFLAEGHAGLSPWYDEGVASSPHVVKIVGPVDISDAHRIKENVEKMLSALKIRYTFAEEVDD